ncbi:hypothetical protein [Paraburkholderia caballeronis]|nr:hypothetical protein [Paraburkholderia caballeronis]TDV16324.1 hypothetical protein C7406_108185 [Paraburkholderia caballeronis]TDV20674.1 hypothetical protein C7408_101185 [Paraburkholderia caballeronis]TDV33142.1 hypothetical protein C7404_101281 [Paraburkholderia caballeronis]
MGSRKAGTYNHNVPVGAASANAPRRLDMPMNEGTGLGLDDNGVCP